MKGSDLHPTEYFLRQTAKRRISRDVVNYAFDHQVERHEQEHGRIVVWRPMPNSALMLRIVLVDEGRALLNAFPDSGYTGKRTRS